jgi:hypothetical protein
MEVIKYRLSEGVRVLYDNQAFLRLEYKLESLYEGILTGGCAFLRQQGPAGESMLSCLLVSSNEIGNLPC